MLTFDLMPEKGIKPDTSKWSDISIYPNPMEDQLQIYFKKNISGRVYFRIYDICGRLVYERSYLNPEPNMPIRPGLSTGIYVLSVIVNNENPKSFKIFVK